MPPPVFRGSVGPLRVAAQRALARGAPDVAARHKAVQWHLGNVYPKLGISGRKELPAELAQVAEV